MALRGAPEKSYQLGVEFQDARIQAAGSEVASPALIQGNRSSGFDQCGLFSRDDSAVIICASANGLDSMMLFGTPCDDQSAALSPLI